MLILPLIDLLILSGTGFLAIGFVLKAISVTTTYHPAILGFSSMDFVIFTGICWAFALTLAARSWVRLNEPKLLAVKREQLQARARAHAHEIDYANSLDAARNGNGEGTPADAPPLSAASAERR
ncbi:MAG: hypothetical protein QNK04_13035 [Myxococcota bacterium]|nr:hypothetical protein [Myxococcota bacterium]